MFLSLITDNNDIDRKRSSKERRESFAWWRITELRGSIRCVCKNPQTTSVREQRNGVHDAWRARFFFQFRCRSECRRDNDFVKLHRCCRRDDDVPRNRVSYMRAGANALSSVSMKYVRGKRSQFHSASEIHRNFTSLQFFKFKFLYILILFYINKLNISINLIFKYIGHLSCYI